jgi:hypothetical protein
LKLKIGKLKMSEQQIKILKMAQCLQKLLNLVRSQILYNKQFITNYQKACIARMYQDILFLFHYAVNNTQAIICLAENSSSDNNSLVHSAFVITRVVIETNSKLCWLLQPDDIIDQITRYILYLDMDLYNIDKYQDNYNFSQNEINGLKQKSQYLKEYISSLTDELFLKLELHKWLRLNIGLSVVKSFLDLEINIIIDLISNLENLTKDGNRRLSDTQIVKAVYTDKFNYLYFDYMILSKFIHSMHDIVYPLTYESRDISSDWDTPFRVCFITLIISSFSLLDRFDANSDNFSSQVALIKEEFDIARQ